MLRKTLVLLTYYFVLTFILFFLFLKWILGLVWFYSISTIVGLSYWYTVLFQTIQFSINTQFSFIWPIDCNLSNATIPGERGLGSDGNEGMLCIPQSSGITGTLPSDCLASYPEHSLWGLTPSAEVQLVYSTAPVY